MASRSSISHHGVLSGWSSRLMRSSSRRSGGNFTLAGLGGVKRSSHQMTGSSSRAPSASGVVKVNDWRKLIGAGLRQ